MQVVIFSGGTVVDSLLVRQTIEKADVVLAADSGADSALALGIYPEIVIGDMDSIDSQTSEKLKKKNVKFVTSSAEKDETDTELAIDYAISKGATEITIIGGIYGDRIDHVMANIMYAIICKVPLGFINGMQRSFVMQGPTDIHLKGQKNDILSLVPLSGDAEGLESTGLQWELHDSTLTFGKPRGVSNVFTQNEVTLSWKKGWLFITHTHIAYRV